MPTNTLYPATVLGSPCFWGAPYQDHTPEQLAALHDLGYRAVFVNIAWSRPWLDVVTLEEMIVAPSYPFCCDPPEDCAQKTLEMRRRVDAILAAGLEPWFLFGSPRALNLDTMTEEQQTYCREQMQGSRTSRISRRNGVACIQASAVRDLYSALLQAHLAAFPETAGFLIYTMDELAEVCDEADDCPRCQGVPLEERLPGYLAHLRAEIDRVSPDIRMFWESWEFAATQVYAMVERLPERVNLAVHSCLHEVYYVNQPDLWFHHLMRLAEANDVEVMVNLFLSGTGEDLGPVASYPCPRLVWQQLSQIARYPAVRALKEYYGTAVEHLNVNDWALRATLRHADPDWDVVADGLAERYAPIEADTLLMAWEHAALALEVYPWDLTWRLRLYNTYRYDQHPGFDGYWDCGWLNTLATPWTTPSWESSRRGFYVTSDFGTPRLLDETNAGFARCMQHVATAEAALDTALDTELAPSLRDELAMQRVSLTLFRLMARMRQLHLRASRAAEAVRQGDPEQVETLATLLDQDLANARSLLTAAEGTPWQAFFLDDLRATIATMAVERADYDADPSVWCAGHLL